MLFVTEHSNRKFLDFVCEEDRQRIHNTLADICLQEWISALIHTGAQGIPKCPCLKKTYSFLEKVRSYWMLSCDIHSLELVNIQCNSYKYGWQTYNTTTGTSVSTLHFVSFLTMGARARAQARRYIMWPSSDASLRKRSSIDINQVRSLNLLIPLTKKGKVYGRCFELIWL